MKPIKVIMPLVVNCSARECSYNSDETCHARAITVGDGQDPRCDTFFKGDAHVQHKRKDAGVGACKVCGCEYNEDFECMADNVKIGLVSNEVKCETFECKR